MCSKFDIGCYRHKELECEQTCGRVLEGQEYGGPAFYYSEEQGQGCSLTPIWPVPRIQQFAFPKKYLSQTSYPAQQYKSRPITIGRARMQLCTCVLGFE